MKKLLPAALLILLVLSTAYAQEEYKRIEEFNGHDWITWNTAQKEQYVLGFISGTYAIYLLIEKLIPDAPMQLINKLLIQGVTTTDIYKHVDAYYNETQQLDTPIMFAIYMRKGGN